MSHGIDEPCPCGHPYPEHSMFDVCHGCSDCADVADGAVADEGDHPYRQCQCREFRSIDEEQIAG